jgi:hypothetical protein
MSYYCVETPNISLVGSVVQFHQGINETQRLMLSSRQIMEMSRVATPTVTILNKVPPFAAKLLSVHLFIVITPHYMFQPTGRPSSGAI